MRCSDLPKLYDTKRRVQYPKKSHHIGVAWRLLIGLFLVVLAGLSFSRRTPSPTGISTVDTELTEAQTNHGTSALEKREAIQIRAAERLSHFYPQYKGPGKQEVFPAFADALRLMLATHSRLLWYRYDRDESSILHEGHGVYYGVFSGDEIDLMGAPSTVWVVSRPNNWHPATSTEWLLNLDINSGELLSKVQINSTFAHDAVRRRNKVYIASTGEGQVIEMSFPEMTVIRTMELFTREEHVNTLAVSSDGMKLWVVLHNLGQSILVEVDLSTGKEVKRLTSIGLKSHGLVLHGDNTALVLDSERAMLVQVNLIDGQVSVVWHSGLDGYFFKGLVVVDDIAFIGIGLKSHRKDRADMALMCQLAAFDLRAHKVLFRRQLATNGLLNIIAAPHLSVESTQWRVAVPMMASYRNYQGFDLLGRNESSYFGTTT